MRFLGGRRRLLEDVEAARRESRAAADAAASAEAAAALAARQVAEFTSRPDGEPTSKQERRRFLRLCLFVVFAVAVTLAPIMYLAPAFQGVDPYPYSTGRGALFVESTSDESPVGHLTGVQPVIDGSLSFGTSSVQYDLFFPKAYAGRKFALVMSGDAVMKNVVFSHLARQPTETPDVHRVHASSGTCTDPIAPGVSFWDKGQRPDRCQVVLGTVPADSLIDAPGCPSSAGPGFIEVTINAVSPGLTVSIDWAHDVSTTPSFETADSIAGTDPVSDSWSGQPLGTPMALALPGMCQTVDASPSWGDYVPQEQPDTSTPKSFTWEHAGWEAVSGTHRNASTIGNLMLLAIGAGFGLSFGFIPVAYEARRSWKRAKLREQ